MQSIFVPLRFTSRQRRCRELAKPALASASGLLFRSNDCGLRGARSHRSGNGRRSLCASHRGTRRALPATAQLTGRPPALRLSSPLRGNASGDAIRLGHRRYRRDIEYALCNGVLMPPAMSIGDRAVISSMERLRDRAYRPAERRLRQLYQAIENGIADVSDRSD
jgi:hypothetical protein